MDKIKAIKQRLGFDAYVILFGSRARGDFYPDSDYDIAIVSDAFADKDILERRSLVRDAIRSVITGKPVDIVCYTPDEYRAGSDAFLPHIIDDEGIKA